jgi:hypothetical protein
MRTLVFYAIFAAGISMLLAQGSQPKSGRIGPAEIYPDP